MQLKTEGKDPFFVHQAKRVCLVDLVDQAAFHLRRPLDAQACVIAYNVYQSTSGEATTRGAGVTTRPADHPWRW